MRRRNDLRGKRTGNFVLQVLIYQYFSLLFFTCLPWIVAGQVPRGASPNVIPVEISNASMISRSTTSSSRCVPARPSETLLIETYYGRICPNLLQSVQHSDGVIEGVAFPNAFGDNTVEQALQTSSSRNVTTLYEKLMSVADSLPQLVNVQTISFRGRFKQLLCLGLFPVCQKSATSGNDSLPVAACSQVCRDMSGIYSITTWQGNGTSVSREEESVSWNLLRLSRVCPSAENITSCVDCGISHVASSDACFSWSNHTTPRLPIAAEVVEFGFCPSRTCASELVPTKHMSQVPQLLQAVSTRISSVIGTLLDTPTSSALLSCGLPCNSSVFSPETPVRHGQAVVVVLSGVALSISLLACVNYAVHYEVMSRFPTRIVMYLNTCSVVFNLTVFLTSLLTWTGVKSAMCYNDGSLRADVPRLDRDQADISFMCVASAMLLSFLTFACGAWWLALIHGWYKTSKSLDNLKLMARLPRLETFYNIAVWLSSAVVTIAFASTGKISAIPIAGLCFSQDPAVVVFFFGMPTIVLTSLTAPMMYIGHRRLKEIWVELERKGRECGSIVSPRAVTAHRDTLRRLGIYLAASLVILGMGLIGIVLFCVYVPQAELKTIDHLVCMQLSCRPEQCVQRPHMSPVVTLLLPLLSILVTAFLSGWIFSKAKWADVKVSARRSVTKISEQLQNRLTVGRVDARLGSLSLTTLPSLDIRYDAQKALVTPDPSAHNLPVQSPLERRGVVRFVRGVVNPFVAPLLCTTSSYVPQHVVTQPSHHLQLDSTAPADETMYDDTLPPRSPLSCHPEAEERNSMSHPASLTDLELTARSSVRGAHTVSLLSSSALDIPSMSIVGSISENEVFPSLSEVSIATASAQSYRSSPVFTTGCGDAPPHPYRATVSEYLYPHISIESLSDPVIKWRVVMDKLRRPSRHRNVISLSHIAAAVRKSTASLPRRTSSMLERLTPLAKRSPSRQNLPVDVVAGDPDFSLHRHTHRQSCPVTTQWPKEAKPRRPSDSPERARRSGTL